MIGTQVPAQLLKGLALIPELDLANVLDRAADLPGAGHLGGDSRRPAAKGLRLAEMLGNGRWRVRSTNELDFGPQLKCEQAQDLKVGYNGSPTTAVVSPTNWWLALGRLITAVGLADAGFVWEPRNRPSH